MFFSITSRIMTLGVVVVIAVLSLVWMLVGASVQTRESFHWVTHSAQVIETVDDALVALRDAESGQRGFVLTHNPAFAESYGDRVGGARRSIARVVALTVDNPIQNARAKAISRLIDQRIAVLQKPFELAEQGDFDAARAIIAGGQGRELMGAISLRAESFLEEEHDLQTTRVAAANQRLTQSKWLALVGGPFISLLIAAVSFLTIRGIRRPLDVVHQAMTALGEGSRDTRIDSDMGSREFSQLARGYNAMADQLENAVTERGQSEVELQNANFELLHQSEALRDRGQVIELLGGMAHRMQAARTDEELAQVIRVFVPRVLPGRAGALYAFNNSRNLLTPITGWGGLEPGPDGFGPDDCWALRRGQSHFVTEPGSDIVCAHVHGGIEAYHCEPLLAGGQVLGTLFFEGRINAESQFRLTVMAENIASALFNHQLQRGLREQTIRDPLTGLFNRRYMQESLAIEIARSSRTGTPLSLVMCDVDHFKRFNDEYGHDAGDFVLQAVAAEMRAQFREGDIVCRFGGEEFTIIAPGTTAEAFVDRVERVRQAISAIKLRQGQQALGTTSMSFGVATWESHMGKDGAGLIQAADKALYRAKREGRNRIVVELRATA